jgi:hypothetical protein
MSQFRKRSVLLIAAAVLMAAQRHSLAGSATWATNPFNSDWNFAGNWIPATVPNGFTDVATFGSSTVTGVKVLRTVEVSSVSFASGAASFHISVEGIGINLFVSGPGIRNESGMFQSFTANGGQSAIFFENTATAGNMTSFSGDAPQFIFYNISSAGSASFDVSSNGIFQASLGFWDSTSAADATITAGNAAIVSVYDFATAGNAVFTIATGATLFIGDDATADHATVTCIGGNGIFPSEVLFQQSGSAAEGYFTALGGSTGGEAGSDIEFDNSATAANGKFVINGGTARGLSNALLFFEDSSTAANATIIANGGVGGAKGGAIIFDDESSGGTASISLSGNGELDIGGNRLTV